jgi:hypothetical protein
VSDMKQILISAISAVFDRDRVQIDSTIIPFKLLERWQLMNKSLDQMRIPCVIVCWVEWANTNRDLND